MIPVNLLNIVIEVGVKAAHSLTAEQTKNEFYSFLSIHFFCACPRCTDRIFRGKKTDSNESALYVGTSGVPAAAGTDLYPD